MNANIYCLQDTHFIFENEEDILKKWGGRGVFSYKSSNARGMAILFDQNAKYVIKKSKCDNDGNYVALSIQCGFLEFSLISLYEPNNDHPDYFRDIEQILLEYDDPHKIVCGDWNLVQSMDLDTCNYLRLNNRDAT